MQRTPTHNNSCAYQSGESVDIGSQHRGDLPDEHVAHYPAADPRQRAEQNGRDRTDVKRQRFICAGGDEKAETSGVEQQDRAAQPIDQGIPENGDRARKDGNGNVFPIVDSRRRNGSDHDVPGNAARVSGREAEDQNAKEIELVFDGFGRTAEGEDECSCQVEYRQQRIGKMRIDGGRLDQRDSQACAATTIASTPAFKVGWITGANPGL